MRDWLLFVFAVILVSVMVVIGAGCEFCEFDYTLPIDQQGQVVAGIALISEAVVLCISAQNHLWRMVRAMILFFYWPLFFLMMVDAHPRSWLDASMADPTSAVILITLASVVGIVLGLFWYLVTLARSTAPRTVMVHGQRYVIREDARGPYLDPAPYERQYP